MRSVHVLGYPDGAPDRVEAPEATGRIVQHLGRIRPQVVITFDPFGAHGHPDHIAIGQLATAAVSAAGDPGWPSRAGSAPPHGPSKPYYMAWDEAQWAAYQAAFRKLVSVVGGVERQARPSSVGP